MMHKPFALSSVHDALVTYHALLDIRSLSESLKVAASSKQLHEVCY